MKSSLRRVLNSSPPRSVKKSSRSSPPPTELPPASPTHSIRSNITTNHSLPTDDLAPPTDSQLAQLLFPDSPTAPVARPSSVDSSKSPRVRLIHRSPTHSPPVYKQDLFSPTLLPSPTLLAGPIQLSSPLRQSPTSRRSFSTSTFRPAGSTAAMQKPVEQEVKEEEAEQEIPAPIIHSFANSKFRPAGSTLATKKVEQPMDVEPAIEGDFGPPPTSFDVEAYANRMAARQSPDPDTIPIALDEGMVEGHSSDIEIVVKKKAAAKAVFSKAKKSTTTTLKRSQSRSVPPLPVVDVLPDATLSELTSAKPTGWFAKPASLIVDPSVAPSNPLEEALFAGTVGTKADREMAKLQKQALLARLPPFTSTVYPVPPTIIYSTKELEIKRVLGAMKGPLAFDLEWPVSNRRGVEFPTALAQVCDDKTILLIHLAKMKGMSKSLKAMLENPEIKKFGVMISGDGKKIDRDFGVKCQGLVELNECVRKVDKDRWKARSRVVGMQDLAGFYLQRFLTKDPNVRCGSWDKVLTISQKTYAANDVYATLKIFQTLQQLGGDDQDLTASPPAPPPRVPLAPTTGSTIASSTTVKSRAPKPPATKSTPRQAEAYHLFLAGHCAANVSAIMSTTRKIAPLSVVWNLLGYLDFEKEAEFDDERLLLLVEGVEGNSKGIMLAEFSRLIEEVEGRVATA